MNIPDDPQTNKGRSGIPCDVSQPGFALGTAFGNILKKTEYCNCLTRKFVLYSIHGKVIEPRRLLPSCFNGGSSNPPDERKEGDAMYVTYSDLIQIGIFIVALIGLCYTIFRGKRK